MKPALIVTGAVVGAALLALTVADSPADAIAPVTDFLDTWDMTNNQALQHPNVRAMLMLIRTGEGTADNGGYSRLVGGGSFSGWDDHPRQSVYLKRLGTSSTAAGAYQILSRTWNMVKLQAGLTDFTPESQDIAAVQLIRNRGALADVLRGDLDAALRKLSWEWASLPPYRYSGQGNMTAARAADLFANFGGETAYV